MLGAVEPVAVLGGLTEEIWWGGFQLLKHRLGEDRWMTDRLELTKGVPLSIFVGELGGLDSRNSSDPVNL